LFEFSESVFIVTACHPFDLTRNFTQRSPKASRYAHIFAGEKSSLTRIKWIFYNIFTVKSRLQKR